MSNSTAVSSLTSYLRRLASKRSTRLVTADDAQRFITSNFPKASQNYRLSLIRSALSEPYFRATGSTPSARPAAKGRRITAWTPVRSN